MFEYQDAGLYDPYSQTYSAYPSSWDTSSGIDFGSGWSGFFQNIGGVAASTWAQKTLMQQNQEGQSYLEGQRLLVANQQAAALAASKAGGTSQLLLLAGLVGLFMLLKD